MLGAIALSLYAAGIGRQDMVNPDGLPLLLQFLAASLHPDVSPAFLLLVLKATLTTLAYAVCGTCLSVILGLIGGVLLSEVWWSSTFPQASWQRWLWLALRLGLAVPRAIHELIWGLFFLNIFGLDPLVAILAIALPYSAIVAKVFSEILDETPRQPLLALLNSGVAPCTAFLYSLMPQAFLNLLSYVFYRFECSLRSAAVLGMIGAGGLGYEIFLSLQSLHYEQLWTLFTALFLLNGSVDLSSALLRRRLGSPSRLDLGLTQLGDFARAAPAKIRPKLSGRRTKCVSSVDLNWQKQSTINFSAGVAAGYTTPHNQGDVRDDFSKQIRPSPLMQGGSRADQPHHFPLPSSTL